MSHERKELERTKVKEVVNEYLSLSRKFENPPKIVLKLNTQSPNGGLINAESVAASTAIQCYSPGVAKMADRNDEKAIGIAQSTLEGGHHTTRMHTNYTWQITGVTRSATHDVFHATPFYNSEQQSQRYVEAKDGNYLKPKDLTPEQSEFFNDAAEFANRSYFLLLDKLKPVVEEKVREMNPEGGWKVESTKSRLESKIQKLSQEVARYVLPIGQHTNYFHTLNELQLLRLFRASQMPNFTDEARFVIGSMINEVAKIDPTILNELEMPIKKGDANYESAINTKEFDQFLAGATSRLVDSPQQGKFGPKIVFDRKLMADVYDVGMYDPGTSTLRNVWLTYATKISHAGDSQRQRHRRTASPAQDIKNIYTGDHDFMVPMVVKGNPELLKTYNEVNHKMFENVQKAIEMGIPKDYALLLLPNSINVRVFESGDLFDWVHRWKQRLCYLAQEEIFFVSLDQVKDLEKVMPEVSPLLMAPCGLRKGVGISPRCPEGSRWCGQPVYNWQLDQYAKHRLI